jgi:hypothetical protein
MSENTINLALRRMDLLDRDRNLPKKRNGLEGRIKSWFRDLSTDGRRELAERLFAERFVKENEKRELAFDMTRLRSS